MPSPDGHHVTLFGWRAWDRACQEDKIALFASGPGASLSSFFAAVIITATSHTEARLLWLRT